MDDDGDNFEEEAKKFVRFLVAVGNQSFSDAGGTDEDRTNFEIGPPYFPRNLEMGFRAIPTTLLGLRNLESGSREITKILRGIRTRGGASIAEHGFDSFWKALAGAYIIGGGRPTDSQKKLLVKELASAGGKKSSETRKTKAEDGYRKDAFDLALSIRSGNKNLSQTRLATEIACRWRLKEPCRESMLVPLIREWEKQGILPKRQPLQK